MKNFAIAAAVMTILFLAGPQATMAQVDRSSATERACKAKYDDIFANLNSSSPTKRRVSDDEIGWALRYEQVKNDGKPCSEADAKAPATAKTQTAAAPAEHYQPDFTQH